jgi:hypothetical protein
MEFSHITLYTGHVTTFRLDSVAEDIINLCRPLLPSGGRVPAFPAFQVKIDIPIFTILRAKEPLVTCGIGKGVDDVWNALCSLQERFLPVNASPPDPETLWLGVVLLPGLVNTASDDISWLGDFEKCLAITIVTDRR